MSAPSAEKLRIGISACLYGYRVRYDGASCEAVSALGTERDGVELYPVCPEYLAGLGVPRPRIRLTGPGEAVLAGAARVLDENGRDVTAAACAGVRACVDALESACVRGVVLKERSPSCGCAEAPIGGAGGAARRGEGVFAAACRLAGLVLLTERDVATPEAWREALGRLGAL